jgi:mannose-6-phosphate isomerase-like protein (cupin superfamily)
MFAMVQVLAEGGENNLHSHATLDGFWFVLKGRVRFYSDFTTVAAELGPLEGILVPRGAKYWFESASKEPLELLQVECSEVPLPATQLRANSVDRVDYEPQKESMRTLSYTEAKAPAD